MKGESVQMILNYSHNDIKRLTPAEQHKMGQGLCPKCGNDKFKIEENLMSRTMGNMGGGNVTDFLVCIICDYTTGTHIFSPRQYATAREIMPIDYRAQEEKENERRWEAERRENERKREAEGKETERRRNEYKRLVSLWDTASTEEHFRELFLGFSSLSQYQEYKDKGVDMFSLECEEEYLVLKYNRLKQEKDSAKTESEFKHLLSMIKQTSAELRNFADKKQQHISVQMPTPMLVTNSDEPLGIIGKWERIENEIIFYWIFNNDNTFETNSIPIESDITKGTYTYVDEKHQLTLSCRLGDVTISAKISENNFIQTLPVGTSLTHVRVKQTSDTTPSHILSATIGQSLPSTGSAIVGRWEGRENGDVFYWIFNNDNTFETNLPIYDGITRGEYDFNGHQLSLAISAGCVTISVAISGNRLTITMPNGLVCAFNKLQ